MSEHFSRGKAIWFLAGIPATAVLLASAASTTQVVADTPEASPAADTADATKMKATLNYVDKSTTTGQACSSCSFFAATSGGDGTCKLISGGTVKAAGWCKSWAAK